MHLDRLREVILLFELVFLVQRIKILLETVLISLLDVFLSIRAAEKTIDDKALFIIPMTLSDSTDKSSTVFHGRLDSHKIMYYHHKPREPVNSLRIPPTSARADVIRQPKSGEW